MQQQTHRSPWTGALILILALGFAWALTSAVQAQGSIDAASGTTITVNTETDELNSDGDCSLREALQAANTDTAVDACPAGDGWDTIVLPTGTYLLDLSGSGDNDNLTGDLDVMESVTIQGAGAGSTTIDGDFSDRVFHFPVSHAGTLELLDVTVENGKANGGAGLRAANSLILIRDSVFADNASTANGGAIWLQNGSLRVYSSTLQHNATGPTGRGGGIYAAQAVVSLQSSTVYSNTSYQGGGLGVYQSSVTLGSTDILSNTSSVPAAPGGAGIMLHSSTLIVEDGSEIAHNEATGNGGGIWASATSRVAVSGSRLKDNQAYDGGGGYIKGAGTIISNSTLEDNQASSEGGGLFLEGDTLVESSTLAHNAAPVGGGIHQLTKTLVISSSTVYSNTANNGGGISLDLGSGLDIQSSLLNENHAKGYGGAIYIFDESGAIIRDSAFRENKASDGGAIALNDDSGLVVDRTTFKDNTVANGYGGGIFFGSYASGDVRNSTFSGNHATFSGGAIYFEENALGIQSSTIVDNSASVSGGGIYYSYEFAPQNSIIAGNRVAGSLTDAKADCDDNGGKFFSGGNNIVGDGTGCAATRYDRTYTPAQVLTNLLHPLADNSGTTLPDGSHPQTFALRSGSLAIDAGDDNWCPDIDQRGVDRPQGNACDVGAYESDASASVTPPSNNTITVDNPYSDSLVEDGDCTLREAIEAANNDGAPVDQCATGSGWDTIILPAGTYTLTSGGEYENANATGDLDVLDHVTVRGAGAGSTVILADFDSASDRLFNSREATLVLQDVTLTQAGTGGAGGCVENYYGQLLIVDSILESCFARVKGGAIHSEVGLVRLVRSEVKYSQTQGSGGGIVSENGLLSLDASNLISNTSWYHGGGFASEIGTARISASTIVSNSVTISTDKGGGGVYSERGALLINDETKIRANTSTAPGGGLAVESGAHLIEDSELTDNHSDLVGGGIDAQDGMWLRNSLVQDNTATNNGGGIHGGGIIQASTIRSNEATGPGGGLHAWGLLENTLVDQNEAPSAGGIYAAGLTLVHSAVENNEALSGEGGGIRSADAEDFGSLLIIDSRIYSNSAPGDKRGAGIFAGDLPITLRRSTISDNTSAQDGGGIWQDGGVIDLLNSTISGNSADKGAGIYNETGTTALLYSTVAANSAIIGAGGMRTNYATIEDSIVAGNEAGGSATAASADCETASPATYGGYSLFGDSTGCAAGHMDQTVTPADVFVSVLGPLADNGGPQTASGGATKTHALLPSSPALDAADDNLCPTTDQRGVSRPQGSACDIGAFESANQLLEVDVMGTGSGAVSSQPPGISCPGDCEEAYSPGTKVTLTAAADAGSNFAGWSGACSNAIGDCLVTMDAARSVTATFALEQANTKPKVYLPMVTKNQP